METKIYTSCFLTLEPVLEKSMVTGERIVTGAKVSKITQVRPTVPAGAPVIHLKLRIPISVLEPLEALLEVPEKDIGIIEVITEESTDTLEDNSRVSIETEDDN